MIKKEAPIKRHALTAAMLGIFEVSALLVGCDSGSKSAQSGGTESKTEAAAPEAPKPEAAAPAVAEAPKAEAAAPAASTETAAAAGGDAGKGKKAYESVCFACHAAGVAGAPKFGDKGAWAPRIAQGIDLLHEHALKGFQGQAGMMPPKGGSQLPDEDVKAAVDYMVSQAK